MPDVQVRLLPYLQTQLEAISKKDTFNEEQLKTLKFHLELLTAAPTPTPAPAKIILPDWSDVSGWISGYSAIKTRNPLAKAVPDPGTVAVAAATPAASLEYTFADRPAPKIPLKQAFLTVLSFAICVLGFFYYRLDLPPGAGFFTMVKSRLLLLLIDTVIAFPVLRLLFQGNETFVRNTLAAADRKMGYGGILPESPTGFKSLLNSGAFSFSWFVAAYVLVQAHIKYVGPITFWHQAIQFLINLPIIIFTIWAQKDRVNALSDY
jgi:hypothetical protein